MTNEVIRSCADGNDPHGVVAVVVGRLATSRDICHIRDRRGSESCGTDNHGECDRDWTRRAGGDDDATNAGTVPHF
ncbi:MAG: hypothetical protein M3R52_08015 [Acidobacteriota bacterium]|nr:hypothetical protein [Acidobacteriota bacterium]